MPPLRSNLGNKARFHLKKKKKKRKEKEDIKRRDAIFISHKMPFPNWQLLLFSLASLPQNKETTNKQDVGSLL